MGLWRALCFPLAGTVLLGVANAAVSLADPIDVSRTYMVEFVEDYVLHPLAPAGSLRATYSEEIV